MLPVPATALAFTFDETDEIGEAGEAELAPRVCGRCRQEFEGDPSLHPGALPEWWLCPPCRLVLLPSGS